MSLSSFSLILGVFCYVFGFPLVFSDSRHLAWRKKILEDENTMRIVGMALVMIAITTVKHRWVVTWDGEGFIVALAWVTLLKGLFIAWWPRTFAKMENRMLKANSMQAFSGFVMVLLGALFTYIGILLP